MSKRSLSRQESNSKAKKSNTNTDKDGDAATSSGQTFPFKNKNFQHSGAVRSGKKKSWKNLRQVAQAERLQVPVDTATYLTIDSPTPIKPAKKYSDISGQLAIYTDPETGLHYATAAEYKQIKRLSSDIVQGYLALRGAGN